MYWFINRHFLYFLSIKASCTKPVPTGRGALGQCAHDLALPLTIRLPLLSLLAWRPTYLPTGRGEESTVSWPTRRLPASGVGFSSQLRMQENLGVRPCSRYPSLSPPVLAHAQSTPAILGMVSAGEKEGPIPSFSGRMGGALWRGHQIRLMCFILSLLCPLGIRAGV